jgi:serine/threonine protein phosphatase 1
MGHCARMFPEGRVGFAVGDIHGRADLLARMLDRLEAEPGSCPRPPVVIFLGDYIDRGPDSAEVIELLRLGRPEGFERRFLKGNHEAAMLGFLADPVRHRQWLSHGGLDTLVSYGVELPSLGSGPDALLQCARALRERLPAWDEQFFNALERYAVMGDYLFVHAGVNPNAPLEQQTDADLFWIRDKFLDDTNILPHRIVHGHTPEASPYADSRRVGVDTGAYASGVLTAARFEGDGVTFLLAEGR